MLLNFGVVPLSVNNKDDIKKHLLRLDHDSRRMRFFMAIGDAGIERYVDRINWGTDSGFGVFNATGDLIAFAHLAETDNNCTMELGVSIDSNYRRRGIAGKLMKRIITFCKARGVDKLTMECLRENKVMQEIATNCGAQTVIDEETAIAQAAIKTTFGERMHEIQKDIVYENIAVIDSQVRKFYEGLFALLPKN